MKSLLVVLFLLFVSTSFSQSVEYKVRLVISSEMIQCEGEMIYPCFQAKKETDPYWTMTIDYIEGFEFEPGIEYVLDLNIEHISQPKQDASSVKYTLVQIVEKRNID